MKENQRNPIVRYDLVEDHDGSSGYPISKSMEPDPDGEFCKYDDYAKLELALLESIKQNNTLRVIIDGLKHKCGKGGYD